MWSGNSACRGKKKPGRRPRGKKGRAIEGEEGGRIAGRKEEGRAGASGIGKGKKKDRISSAGI